MLGSPGRVQYFGSRRASSQSARNAGLAIQVPNRSPDTASRVLYQRLARPIAEANAAPETATAAWTVRSRRKAGGTAPQTRSGRAYPASGPPIQRLEKVKEAAFSAARCSPVRLAAAAKTTSGKPSTRRPYSGRDVRSS